MRSKEGTCTFSCIERCFTPVDIVDQAPQQPVVVDSGMGQALLDRVCSILHETEWSAFLTVRGILEIATFRL